MTLNQHNWSKNLKNWSFFQSQWDPKFGPNFQQMNRFLLKIHWKPFTILQIKKACEVTFFGKVYVFWNSIQYSLFVLQLQLLTVLLLISDSYMSRSTGFASWTACVGFFIFISVLIKFYSFFYQKAWTFWLWNAIIAFKITMIEKPHTLFCSQTSQIFLSCSKNF